MTSNTDMNPNNLNVLDLVKHARGSENQQRTGQVDSSELLMSYLELVSGEVRELLAEMKLFDDEFVSTLSQIANNALEARPTKPLTSNAVKTIALACQYSEIEQGFQIPQVNLLIAFLRNPGFELSRILDEFLPISRNEAIRFVESRIKEHVKLSFVDFVSEIYAEGNHETVHPLEIPEFIEAINAFGNLADQEIISDTEFSKIKNILLTRVRFYIEEQISK